MKKDETVIKNVSLVFDFLRYVTEHPKLLEKLPDECELEFLDRDFPVVKTEDDFKNKEKTYLKVEHTFDLVT